MQITKSSKFYYYVFVLRSMSTLLLNISKIGLQNTIVALQLTIQHFFLKCINVKKNLLLLLLLDNLINCTDFTEFTEFLLFRPIKFHAVSCKSKLKYDNKKIADGKLKAH